MNLLEDKNFVEELLECSSYRDFLSLFIQKKKTLNSSYSYTVFSAKAGLKSRSFIRGVIVGEKDLSRNSYDKVLKALSLPALMEKFFEQLVVKDCEIGIQQIPSDELERLKRKIISSLEKVEMTSQVYLNHDIPIVFSALGVLPDEDYMPTLIKRTGLSDSRIVKALKAMESQSLVEWDQTKKNYKVKNFSLTFVDEKERRSYFQKHFLHNVEKLAETARNNYSKADQLFYTTALLIKSEKFPKFKEELIKLIDDFTDEIEDEAGDEVIEVTLGMGNHRKGL